MSIDVTAVEEQLKDTLTRLMLEMIPGQEASVARCSQVLADGLTRYLILSRRPVHEKEEELGLMINSLEFWAALHGYSKSASPMRKSVQKQNGPTHLARSATGGA